MKILITGCTGFIGGRLAPELASRHEVCAVARDAGRLSPRRPMQVVEADLLQPLDFKRLPNRIDVVIHLAQHNGPFPAEASELFQVNTVRTQELLAYAERAAARQFILASSGDVYGYRLDSCVETDTVAPASFYGVTKRSSELLVEAYSEYLTPTVFRLFTPYGPGQSGRLIPSLAGRIRQSKPVTLHLGARPLMTPIHVDDVIRAFDRAIETRAQGVFNLAGATVVNVRSLAETLGAIVGKKPLFEETGQDVGNLMGDNTRMKTGLGLSPEIDLQAGLRMTVG